MNNKINQITSILPNIGYNISKQSFKDPQKNPSGVWQAFVYIAKWCQGIDPQKQLDQMDPNLLYIIDDQKHYKAIQWRNEYNLISKKLRSLNLSYTLKIFFKPDKEQTFEILYQFMKYGKYRQQFMEEFNNDFRQIKSLENEIQKNKSNMNKVERVNSQLKEKKQKQFVEYTDIMQRITQIHKEINYKKNQKNEILLQKKKAIQSKDQQMQKYKIRKNALQDKKIKILQLNKQIANNIPQIKHQRIKIQQQYIQEQQIINDLQKLRKKKLQSFQKFIEQNTLHLQQIIQKLTILTTQTSKYIQLQALSKKHLNQIQTYFQSIKQMKKQYHNTLNASVQLQKQRQILQSQLKHYQVRIKQISIDAKTRFQQKVSKQNDYYQLSNVKNDIQKHISLTLNKIQSIKTTYLSKFNTLKFNTYELKNIYAKEIQNIYQQYIEDKQQKKNQ